MLAETEENRVIVVEILNDVIAENQFLAKVTVLSSSRSEFPACSLMY